MFPPQFGTSEYEALPSWQQEDVRLLQDARELEAADLVQRHEQEEAIAAAAVEQNEAMQNVPAARVQELVDEGMAVYVEKTWHSARQVHHNPKGYVVVTDVIGGVVKTVVLEARGDRIGYYRTVWKSPGFELPEDTSVERVAELLADRRTEHRAKLYVDAYVLDPKRVQGAQNTAAALTFVMHMVPGGGFVDYATQGEWGEATISLAGDLALLFSGGLAKLSTAGRLGKFAEKIVPNAARAQTYNAVGVVIEGTIGGVRLGQAGIEFISSDGDSIKAAGYLGEALLRLYGVKTATQTAGAAPDAGILVDQLGLHVDHQRALLRLALGTNGTGKVAHHIIPLEAIKIPQLKRLLEKAAKGGFNINGANAGIALENTIEKIDDVWVRIVRHEGPHRPYSQAVIAQLRRIDQNLDERRIAEEVQKIADRFRKAIEDETFLPINP